MVASPTVVVEFTEISNTLQTSKQCYLALARPYQHGTLLIPVARLTAEQVVREAREQGIPLLVRDYDGHIHIYGLGGYE